MKWNKNGLKKELKKKGIHQASTKALCELEELLDHVLECALIVCKTRMEHRKRLMEVKAFRKDIIDLFVIKEASGDFDEDYSWLKDLK